MVRERIVYVTDLTRVLSHLDPVGFSLMTFHRILGDEIVEADVAFVVVFTHSFGGQPWMGSLIVAMQALRRVENFQAMLTLDLLDNFHFVAKVLFRLFSPAKSFTRSIGSKSRFWIVMASMMAAKIKHILV